MNAQQRYINNGDYTNWHAAVKQRFPNMVIKADGQWSFAMIGPVDIGFWTERTSLIATDKDAAKLLAECINTNQSLTTDERCTVSMTLSAVVKRLGALGIEASLNEPDTNDAEGEENL